MHRNAFLYEDELGVFENKGQNSREQDSASQRMQAYGYALVLSMLINSAWERKPYSKRKHPKLTNAAPLSRTNRMRNLIFIWRQPMSAFVVNGHFKRLYGCHNIPDQSNAKIFAICRAKFLNELCKNGAPNLLEKVLPHFHRCSRNYPSF